MDFDWSLPVSGWLGIWIMPGSGRGRSCGVFQAVLTVFFPLRFIQTAQSGFFLAESEAGADTWVKRISEALQQQQQTTTFEPEPQSRH